METTWRYNRCTVYLATLQVQENPFKTSLLEVLVFMNISENKMIFYTGAYSGFWKSGCNFFRTQVLNCFAPTTLFAFLPYWTLLGVTLGWRDVKKQFFCIPSPLRAGAKLQGGCKGSKRPTLNTPMFILYFFSQFFPYIHLQGSLEMPLFYLLSGFSLRNRLVNKKTFLLLRI